MELMQLDVVQWTALAVSACIVGLTKAGFGAGAGILAVPLMTLVLMPKQMLPIMLPILICGDLFCFIHYPRERDARNLSMLLPGVLVGVGLGYVALDWFLSLGHDGQVWMRRGVGGLSLVFVSILLARFICQRRAGGGAGFAYRPKYWHGVTLGTLAGLTSTLAHSAGPLLAMFLIPQKLDKRVYVGTCVTYFFVGNLAKLLPYLGERMFTTQTVHMSLALMPAVVVGTVIGAFLNKRVSDRIFRLIVYCLATVAGIKLAFF